MITRLGQILVLIFFSGAYGDPELPLCPVNVQYFPQNLPMHCRMPPGFTPGNNLLAPGINLLAPGNNQPAPSNNQPAPGNNPPAPGNNQPAPRNNVGVPQTYDYNSPPPNLMPQPLPFPIPPGFPGPMGYPPPIPLVPGPPPPQKLPVIVMPFYSPDPAFMRNKKPRPVSRRPPHKKSDSDTESCSDTDTDTGSSDADTDASSSSDSDRGFWKFRRGMNKRPSKRRHRPRGRKHRRRRLRMRRLPQPTAQKTEMLTPIIQYLTKDGYVIYEKEISNNEAKDWLDVATEDRTKVNFDELDEINKKYPGDGTGTTEVLTAAEFERNKMDLEHKFKKIEQDLAQEDTPDVTTGQPRLKKWKKRTPKTRKEKFAEKIGTDIDTLS